MGRIDKALRRSNLDAGQGTGAETPAAALSPWAVEQPEEPDGPEPERASAREPVDEAPADRFAPVESGSPARWKGFDAAEAERLVVSPSAAPLLVEQFRSLAATLHRAQLEQPLKSVIVTSASPGDGKSYVSVNLALTLSDSYRRRVLLIDADLRRPSLHLMFGIRNTKGLGDALTAKTDEKLATVQISETLTLLPAGRPEANPLGGLSSGRMKRIVADAASQFDWVIIDSPPVGVLADAHLVSETVDAAILVVRADVTRFKDLEAAADTMGHERILGIVLNAVDPAYIRGHGYYSHYYGSESRRPSE
jgi:capsular exopolysaccharide synthesis family protein